MTPRRLILWDVDGTLVRCGPVGKQVFDQAVQRVLGRHPGDHDVRMSGKTDPQIAREILDFAASSEPTHVDGHVADALVELERELAAAAERIQAEGRCLPGVAELLPRLATQPGLVQTLLTGNIAANAVLKVAAFGLDQWLDLDIGAYGSDDADRLRLVDVALRKAASAHGPGIGAAHTWVIGDTPRDLACARAGGARCLLVATGGFDVAELRALDADAVLTDLSDTDAVLALLTDEFAHQD